MLHDILAWRGFSCCSLDEVGLTKGGVLFEIGGLVPIMAFSRGRLSMMHNAMEGLIGQELP